MKLLSGGLDLWSTGVRASGVPMLRDSKRRWRCGVPWLGRSAPVDLVTMENPEDVWLRGIRRHATNRLVMTAGKEDGCVSWMRVAKPVVNGLLGVKPEGYLRCGWKTRGDRQPVMASGWADGPSRIWNISPRLGCRLPTGIDPFGGR